MTSTETREPKRFTRDETNEFFGRLDQTIVAGMSVRQICLYLKVGESTVRRRKQELRAVGKLPQLQATACETNDANRNQ